MTRPRLQLVALGAATTVAQSVLLREGMAALGGSEITWGLVLAVWLFGIGLGARFGVRWGPSALTVHAPAAVVLAATCGVLILRAAPAITSGAAGEAVTLGQGWWLWILAALPAGFLGGIAFPTLAAEVGCAGDASSAYSLEAVGGVLGGLAFTFILAPFGTATTLCVSFGLTAATGPLQHRRSLAATAIVAGISGSWFASVPLATLSWRYAERPGRLVGWSETRNQRLELGELEDTLFLYGDGNLLASVPDPYDTIPRLHLLMLLHPEPHRVCALGLDRLGAADAILRHPIDDLLSVESDPGLRAALDRWYDDRRAPQRHDPRLRSATGDPARALESDPGWDLILLLDADPTNLRANRTRTRAFFTACRDSMAADGVLALRVGAGDTYLGGAGGDLVALLHRTLADVFPQTAALPGTAITLIAGRREAAVTLDPAVLSSRWVERNRPDERMSEHLLPVLVDPSRTSDLAGFLATAPSTVINTAQRPLAVLLASGLSEGRKLTGILVAVRRLADGPRRGLLVAGATVLAAALISLAFGRRVGQTTGALVGGSSMTWFLILLTMWQVTRGSVFTEIGALTAAFMAGTAAGAATIRRRSRPSDTLPALMAVGCVTSLVILAGLWHGLPAFVIPLLLAVGGSVTGASFAGVAQLAGHGAVRRGAGIGFAADEAGAAICALGVGVVALPVAGAIPIIAILAAAQLAAAVVLRFRISRPQI